MAHNNILKEKESNKKNCENSFDQFILESKNVKNWEYQPIGYRLKRR